MPDTNVTRNLRCHTMESRSLKLRRGPSVRKLSCHMATNSIRETKPTYSMMQSVVMLKKGKYVTPMTESTTSMTTPKDRKILITAESATKAEVPKAIHPRTDAAKIGKIRKASVDRSFSKTNPLDLTFTPTTPPVLVA